MPKAELEVRALWWDQHASSSALFLITLTLEGRIGLKLPYDLIPLPAEVAEKLQQQRPREEEQ